MLMKKGEDFFFKSRPIYRRLDDRPLDLVDLAVFAINSARHSFLVGIEGEKVMLDIISIHSYMFLVL